MERHSLTTTLVNASQLSVLIPAALTALPGSGSITVVNPGAAASNALTFTVTPLTAYVRSVSPSSAAAGGPAFTLTVSCGTLNPILSGAIVQWNGTSLTTTYVSSNQVTAQVPASLIAAPGTANVTIVNPGGSLAQRPGLHYPPCISSRSHFPLAIFCDLRK